MILSSVLRRRAAWALASLLLLVLFALPAAPAWAAPDDTSEQIATELAGARKSLDQVRAASAKDPVDPAELPQLRATAIEIQAKADKAADALAPQLTSIEARLSELGDIPEGETEAADVAARRAQLEKARSTMDAQVKLARLLSVEAGQSVDRISSQRRAEFQAALGKRTTSILGTTFWTEFNNDLPRDTERLLSIWDDAKQAVSETAGLTWLGMLVAAIMIVALRMWAAHRLLKITATRVPSGRLRRSFHSLTLVILGFAIPGLLAVTFHTGLGWDAPLPRALDTLLAGMVAAFCFGGYVGGLGGALLSPYRSSWRLPPITDPVAHSMRAFPVLLGVVLVFIWMVERLTGQISASLPVTVAVNCLIIVVLGGLLAVGLSRFEHVRRRVAADPQDQTPEPRPLWLSVMVGGAWIVLVTAFVCLLGGYVAFGSFIVKQLAWTLIVLCSVYLFAVLAEDTFMTLLARNATSSEPAQPELAQPQMREQAAVLLSGITRVLLALFALLLLLAPFGAGPVELFQRIDQLRGGVSIGEVNINPSRVAQAFLVLGLTLIAVRLFKGWLSRRYLPTTQLDPGMQSSASTLFGYTGVVVAVALALSSIGIGLERVAWIASALSVGIGFGLQAVVQNFVSGLILLAERPVKVGDWVSLGGIEGDIQRVNVRATEIQMADRSTVIVPNSEFITKTVRNVTHANPLGLVQIKLPMPLSTDASEVREIILAAFAEHAGVLETPAPNVWLDGVDTTGNLMFNASAYVASPRAAYGVRSAILFDVLARLREANMAMYRPAAMVLQPAHDDADAPVAQASTPASRTKDSADDAPRLPPSRAVAPPDQSGPGT